MGLLLPVGCWGEQLIVAKIPNTNPGTGEDGETFKIRFQSGSAVWETSSPVIVVGPLTSNYPDPPMHAPQGSRTLTNS